MVGPQVCAVQLLLWLLLLPPHSLVQVHLTLRLCRF
jgi:hypothetical protein